MTTKYQICTRCVMDTTDPDIIFDNNGICNHCHMHDLQVKKNVISGIEGQKRLKEIVSKIKEENKNKKYDCVIGVSGGVDSTYVAYKVKEMGLRPLAVHLDNGWNSELAVKNVENICRKLEIDLHTIVLDWTEFSDLQLSFLKASTPDSEIPSDHAIVASLLDTAKEIGVNYIIAGHNVRTETHLPVAWSQGHTDWGYIKNVQKRFGKIELKTFPHLNFFEFFFPPYVKKFVNILNYLDFSKTEAMPILEKELGWKYYGGKHYESIYTRWYQGYWLPAKFGYDKRRSHLSSLVCAGELTREQALSELETNTYTPELQKEDTAYVLKKFNINQNQLDEIFFSPKKTYWDYAPYARLYRTSLYRGLRSIYRKIKK
ncbi:N-acetyl sugar amidotransferase [Pedobacter sp.]|uniref:N-acetyl sugar amidotransferase n=1 Tax=Pedobacter sp. TaxID=1411316 RepID=UPI0031D0BFA9